MHEDPAGQIDHPDRDTAAGRHHHASPAGSPFRIIGRPEQRLVILDEFHDLFLVPDMISGGQDIDMCGVELFDDLAGHAESRRGIFAVGDDEIDPVLLDDPGKKFADGPSPRFADDIPDKEYLHEPSYRAKSETRVSRMTVTLICPG